MGNRRLKSFSYTFEELTTCDNEREYILPVIERSELNATFIPGDDKWALRDLYALAGAKHDDPAQDVGAWLTTAILEKQHAQGCKVLMTGLGGDELFHGGVLGRRRHPRSQHRRDAARPGTAMRPDAWKADVARARSAPTHPARLETRLRCAPAKTARLD